MHRKFAATNAAPPQSANAVMTTASWDGLSPSAMTGSAAAKAESE
jgi:hypothetical protein